ncbi:MAG: hypothetical protein AAF125_12440, partial [Chloroflexota bacterium]
FVGRKPYLEAERQRDAVVTRFRLNQKGARPPRQGDPIVDARGRVVGIVTSCTPDTDGYQLGLAYLKHATTTPDTPVGVFSGGYKAKASKGDVSLGDRLPVPQMGTVLTRFPRRKRRTS